jgi:hypothetical protein
MNNYQYPQNLPLPNADTFYQESFDMAWQQITIWTAAAAGALLTIWIIKSFVNR